MRYLPPTLADLKNRQDVEPRTGIDLIAIKKYLTYQEPFTAIVYDYFAGTKDTTYVLDTDADINLETYDGLGYHLLADDGTDYGEISDITYIVGTYSLITVTIAVASGNFAIVKLYQSRLDSAPTIDSSMEITGALMQTGNCQFDIANPEEDTFSSGSYNYLAANTLELGSGDALSLDYIGRIARIAHSGGYELDTVITDVDLGTDTITVCDTIRYYVDESYQVSIILQTFFSDIFRTTPNIEDTQCLIRQYLGDNQDVFYETNSIILMDGKIKSIGDLTQESIPVTVYDEEKYLEENKIGNLITEDDGAMVSGAPFESIGMMKPLVFGNNGYSQQTTDHEQATQKNNLCKCVFLGFDAGTGKRRYLVSETVVYGVNDIYIPNAAGRLNKISSTDWTIVAMTADEVVIELDNTIELTDYWTGNETGYYVDRRGLVATGDDPGKAADNNAADYSLLTVDAQGWDALEEGTYFIYDALFDNWDMQDIADSAITAVDTWISFRWDITNYIDPGFIILNGVTINTGSGSDRYEQLGSDSATKTQILAGVRLALYNYTTCGALPIPPRSTLKTYLIIKEIVYNRVLSSEETIAIFADVDGVEYGTWINGRATGDANDNTDQGGFYHYTNANDDDSGDMIENPVSVLEWILREVKGKVNNDLDLDSFNRSSIARSTWKCSFELTEQVESESFLQQFCDEFCLNLQETEEGYIRVVAYDTTAPFTNNNIIFNGATNYISLDVPITISTGRYFIWYGMSSDYATSYQGIVGRSLGAYSYIRFDNPAATKILGETDTDSDLLNWTITSIDDGVFHKIKVINNGSNIYELFLDDVSQGTSTGSTSADVITIDRVGQGRAGTDLLDGKIGYFQVFEDDDSVMIDIKSINEISIDTTGDYKLTETGTFTYELSKEGIYDYHSGISDGEYLHLPIIAGLPKFPKVNTDLFTTLIQNYNKSNISGKYQDTDTDTDTTYVSRAITKEVNLNFIADSTTIEARATLMLILFSRLRRMIEFNSSVASIHHEKGDIVNVWSPVLNNGIYSTSAMKAKKWIVLSKTFDTQMQKYNLIGCELLS